MTYIYAVLNKDGICENVTALEEQSQDENYVLLDDYRNVVGMRPDGDDWVLDETYFTKDNMINGLDASKVIQAELMLNQMEIIDKLNSVEMVGAVMLLMLVEGGMV